jgi:hypothetical protein
MTQSEDDLDLSGVRTRKQRGKRQSLEKSIVAHKKARKSSTVSFIIYMQRS